MMRNRMDAEVVTQEVLIRTWKNIDNFNFYAARAWIMRTTHNLCIDYLRRNSKQNKKEFSLENDFLQQLEDDRNDIMPDKVVMQNLTDTKIKSAIENLPEKLKSPFVLYELQGFKYKEIGKILDIPINSVKVYILRARKYLQKELRSYAGEI